MNNIFDNSITSNSFLRDLSEYLPPGDLLHFEQVNQKLAEGTETFSAWKTIATSIQCPFTQADDTSSLKNKVKNTVFELKKAIRNFPPNEIPKDIRKILDSSKVLTAEEINLMQEFRKARDIITTWKVLEGALGRILALPKNIFESSQTTISFVGGFEQWCQNQNLALGGLRLLDLSEKKLSYLPPQIRYLTGLTNLQLQENQLFELPPEIGNLAQLSHLFLHQNQLRSLPDEFGNFAQLRTLRLDQNKLHILPSTFGNLQQLETLYLSENQLSKLPDEFENLSNLEILYLRNNQLTSISPIEKLTRLEHLDLQKNQIKELPEEIGNLTSLSDLFLGENQLRRLPKTIGKLVNLRGLFVQKNLLRYLPPEIGNLRRLFSLHLQENRLQSLPVQLGILQRLQYLKLNRNNLLRLPTGFGNLTQLVNLNLSHNKLQRIPPEFGNLLNLSFLHLGNNFLTSLPSEFKNLNKLSTLYLNGNKFTEIPEINPTKLSNLSLASNPIPHLPRKVGHVIQIPYGNSFYRHVDLFKYNLLTGVFFALAAGPLPWAVKTIYSNHSTEILNEVNLIAEYSMRFFLQPTLNQLFNFNYF